VAKKKKVLVKLIDRGPENDHPEPYRIMDELIYQHHPHLTDAKIALAWRMEWAEDADGRLTLGQAKKGSDLDRELHDYDFVILLNHEAWHLAGFDEKQRTALIDHELCHLQVAMDDDGEVREDEYGRTVWRIRKHDVEEFKDVVARHGLWTHKLEEFARAGINDSNRALLEPMEAAQ
jgi:hypothetical protein